MAPYTAKNGSADAIKVTVLEMGRRFYTVCVSPMDSQKSLKVENPSELG